MQDPGHPAETPTGDEDQQFQDEHLQTMGRLLLGIAHELNTPLGVVASVCDSMLRCQQKLAELVAKPTLSAEDHDELRNLVGHLESGRPVLQVGLDRVQALVRVLRIAGRPELMEALEPVDLVAVIEADLLLLDHQLKQGITVIRRFASRPTVRGHGVMLGQVFLNLLRNAIQALDGRGSITLTVDQRDGQAVVEVADDGPGIPADVLPRLFAEKVTTKCIETGTGVGLLICQRTVEKHGGRISATNGPTGGAVFTVTLPLA
jgi:two-component system NtrC family sensor kinase